MQKLASVARGTYDDRANETEHLARVIQQAQDNDPALTVFDISNMLHLRTMTKGERDGHLEAIAEALRSNTHIKELLCSNVAATDFFAEEIADAMLENTTVQVLNLETNDLREDGFVAIAGTR